MMQIMRYLPLSQPCSFLGAFTPLQHLRKLQRVTHRPRQGGQFIGVKCHALLCRSYLAEKIFTFPTHGAKIIQELSDDNLMLIEESGGAPNCYVLNMNLPPADPKFCLRYPLGGAIHPGSFRFRRSAPIVTSGYEDQKKGNITLRVDTAQGKLVPCTLAPDPYHETMWHMWRGAPDDRVIFSGTALGQNFGLWIQLPGRPPVKVGNTCDGHPTWCGLDPEWTFYASGTNAGEQSRVDPRYDRRLVGRPGRRVGGARDLHALRPPPRRPARLRRHSAAQPEPRRHQVLVSLQHADALRRLHRQLHRGFPQALCPDGAGLRRRDAALGRDFALRFIQPGNACFFDYPIESLVGDARGHPCSSFYSYLTFYVKSVLSIDIRTCIGCIDQIRKVCVMMVCRPSRILGMVLFLQVISPWAARANISVPLTGPSFARVKWNVNWSATNITGGRVDLTGPGGTTTLAGVGTSLVGDQRVGLAPGNYTLSEIIVYTDGSTRTWYDIDFKVDRFTLAGVLDQSESFAGDGPEGTPCFVQLTMQAGQSLTVSNARLDYYVDIVDGNGKSGQIVAPPGAAVHFSGCSLQSARAWGTVAPTFDNCAIGSLQVIGSAGVAPVFRDCLFEPRGYFYLSNRSASTFTGCVFYDALLFADNAATQEGVGWDAADTPAPVIDGNAFLGLYAFDCSWLAANSHKIHVGSNYFGDAGGPRTGMATFWHCERGAWISGADRLVLGDPLASGPESSLKIHHLPQFWINGGQDYLHPGSLPLMPSLLIGQNTISSNAGAEELLQGRETLISVDLVCSAETVTGARLYAMLDVGGSKIRVDGTRPGRELHRDLRAYPSGANAFRRGESTANIILPPVNQASAGLELWLDTTGVTGYTEAGSNFKIYSSTLQFTKPYDRPLRVAVAAVQLKIPFYNQAMPHGSRERVEVETELPMMLPISSSQIATTTWAPFPVYGSLVNWASLNITLRQVGWGLNLLRWNQDPAPDFVVAVMAGGNMGNWIGAVYPELTRILFVDETHPSVTVHEMGHGIGLQTKKEQYDEYPATNGIPLESATSFIPEDLKLLSYFANGDQSRIYHHLPDHTASPGFWVDTMGRVDGGGKDSPPIWPLPYTVNAFRTFFKATLNTPDSSPKTRLAAAGTKDIVIKGDVLRTTISGGAWPVYGYRLQKGTIRAMAAGSYPFVAPAPTNGGNGEYYHLKCFDASGVELFAQPFFATPEAGQPEDTWVALFNVPGATARIRIQIPYSTNVYFEAQSGGTLTNAILSPIKSTTLGTTLTLAWRDRIGGQVPPAAGPIGQPLQHLILSSTNNGATWQLAGFFVEGEAIETGTEYLPAGNTNAFKVISSDGVNAAEARVDNLRLANRLPVVTIDLPRPGDVGAPGTSWTLAGSAYDVEDGFLKAGVWKSSRDGRLGTGGLLSGIKLSPGAHTLSYAAADRSGTTVTATVAVTAGAIPGVDLQLGPDALRLGGSGPDGSLPAAAWLTVGTTHTAVVSYRNIGRPTTATLALYLTPPGKSATLLARSKLTLAAFETGQVSAAFIPVLPGDYRLRGAIESVTPADINTANNSYTWTFSTSTPPDIQSNRISIDFGSSRLGQAAAAQTLALSNAGQTGLKLNQVSLAGTHAGDFKIVGSSPAGTTLATSQSCTIRLQFTPRGIGTRQAALRITSTDPLKPSGEIPLFGTGLAGNHVGSPAWLGLR